MGCSSTKPSQLESPAPKEQAGRVAVPPRPAGAQNSSSAPQGPGPAGPMVGKQGAPGGAPHRAAPAADAHQQPMPDDAELDRLFEGFMEEKCFKPEVRTTMRSMPKEHKWTILVQEQYKDDSKDQKNEPSYWVQLLAKEAVSLKDLQTLKVVLGGQGKSWLSQFVEQGGLPNLVGLLARDKETQPPNFHMEVMRCLKAFMNNKFGLNLILNTPAAVDQIALSIINGSDQLRMEVIDLLTVVAWLSVEGHASVMEALKNPKFGRRFQVIVDALQRGENVTLKVNVMTFVNAIINARDMLDGRVAVRQEFMDLGLLDAIHKMRSWMDSKRAVGDHSNALAQLTAQFDVFESALRSDKRETTRNNLDLSDVDQIMSHLKQVVMEDGFSNQFIHTLHHLMTIPSEETLGEQIWENVQWITRQATSVVTDEDEHERTELTYDELKAALEEKERADLEKHKNKINELEGIIERQREDLHRVTMEKAAEVDDLRLQMKRDIEAIMMEKTRADQLVHELQSQMKQLQDELAAARQLAAAGGSSGAAAPPPVVGGVPPPPPGIIAGGPPPPPVGIIAGGPPPPPIGIIPGGPPPPPILGGIPPPPPGLAFGGPPPPPILPGMGGPPPPPMLPGMGPPPPPMLPGMGGPPPPPMLGGLRAPVGPQLPPKKVIKPQIPLKAFHWQTVEPRDVPKTIWNTLNDENVMSKFDHGEFEEKFARKEIVKKSETEEDIKEKEKEKKQQQVSLIDGKRSYNVNISLAQFKMTHNAIRDAMLAMDEQVLDLDRVTALLKCAPTPEEIESVTGYDGDIELLGNAEKFFRALSAVPNVATRLEFCQIKLQFNQVAQDIEKSLTISDEAYDAVMKSKSLTRVLELVLAFGNYLNGGTRKGQAYGFKLNTFEKLTGTKTVDNKLTLLHYLVMVVQAKMPEARKFLDELEPVARASRIESAVLEGEIKKLGGQLKKLEAELKNTPDNKQDRFKPVMTAFHEEAVRRQAAMQARFDKSQVQFKHMAEYFGEDPQSCKPEELYKMFNEFVVGYKAAEEALEKMRQEEERAKKMEEAMAAQAAKKEKKSEGHVAAQEQAVIMGSKGKIVDNTLQTLRPSDAKDVMTMLKLRRKQRQSIITPTHQRTNSSGGSTKTKRNVLQGTDNKGSLRAPLKPKSTNIEPIAE